MFILPHFFIIFHHSYCFVTRKLYNIDIFIFILYFLYHFGNSSFNVFCNIRYYLYFTDTLNLKFLVTLTWEKDVSIYIVIIDFICVLFLSSGWCYRVTLC